MGITIANPTLPTIRFEHAPIVYTREAWRDDWQFQPELVPTSVQVCSASHGMSTCTIARRYGYKKEPWESAITQKPPWYGGAGVWVMVAFCGDNGYEPAFYGQIVAENRAPDGNDTGPMGRQTWSCRGPLDQLRKINVSQSTWVVGSEVKTIGWIPPLNVQKENGIIRGNRSTTVKLGDWNSSYHYGGDEQWTYLEYLDYILSQFVNTDPSDADTPIWTLGGQYPLLHSIKEPITFGQTQTVAEVVAKLIPRSKGLEYGIVTTDEGFEIRVFSLNSKEATFGSNQLPSNPNKIDFDAGTGLNYNIQVAESAEEQYGKIRILGKPLVVCCSLNGNKTEVAQYTGKTTLLSGWDPTEASEYCNCTEIVVPASDADAITVCKKYRGQDRFRTIYRIFTASSDFMDVDIGQAVIVPTVTTDGQIDSSTTAPHQYKIRKTLDWVPLYEDIVYGEFEANDRTQTMYADDDGENAPELLPPMAWVGAAPNALYSASDLLQYTPVEKIGASVAALNNHFGLWVEASPNHLLAPELPSYTDVTDVVHDYNTMIVTAAFETDQRLMLEQDVPGGNLDLVKEIYIDAEAWFMASNTCVGIDANNQPIRSYARELRNDRDKMLQAMAGAIARYGNPRSRATITFNGIALWGGLIGYILDTVYTGGVPHKISAPITSVTWNLPDVDSNGGGATTTVHTGYAQ